MSTLQQLQARAEAFNAQFPAGTEVIRYRLVNPLRDPVRTSIRSAAWVMGGHTVMILVAGIPGGVMADSIQVLPPDLKPQPPAAEVAL